MKLKMEKSSGNVFLDLGFSKAESENLHIRAGLMVELKKYMDQNSLTQAKAAKLLGVTQPRISDLRRGKIELFSVDALITMLLKAGLKVDVKVRRSRAA